MSTCYLCSANYYGEGRGEDVIICLVGISDVGLGLISDSEAETPSLVGMGCQNNEK